MGFDDSYGFFQAEQFDLHSDGTFSSLRLVGNNWHPRNDRAGQWQYEQGTLKLLSNVDITSYVISLETLETNAPSQAQASLERFFDDEVKIFITRIDANQDRDLSSFKNENTASHILKHARRNLEFFKHDMSFLIRFNSGFSKHEELIQAASSIKEIEMPFLFPEEMTNRRLVFSGKGYEAENYTINISDTHLRLNVWGVLRQKHVFDCLDNHRHNCEKSIVPVNIPYAIELNLELPEHLQKV